MGIVTLLSDFGSNSPYPAQMKAAVAAICEVTFIDISHDVRRHDVRMGAYFLAAVARSTPAGTVHLAVVDPGVGTGRAPLIITAGGQYFVGPDNGLLLPAARRLGTPRVYEIAAPEIMTPQASPTFHGRDIFAPAAGYLARGAPPDALGKLIRGFVDLEFGTGKRDGTALVGEIIYVDAFGNFITNIPRELLDMVRGPVEIVARRQRARGTVGRTYGDLAKGAIAVLPGSDGMIEIAVREGSAADRFGAAAGDRLVIRPGTGRQSGKRR